jgi:hypothetical protein
VGLGLLLALGINSFARRFSGAAPMLGAPIVLTESLVRIGLSAALYLALLAPCRVVRSSRGCASSPVRRSAH